MKVINNNVRTYLISGSLSKTKAVSLSAVKAKSTFGAVLFLLFKFILLSLLFIFILIFGSEMPVLIRLIDIVRFVRITLSCSISSYNMTLYDMIWYDLIWYDMIWYDMMLYDIIRYDMIWYDMIRYDMTLYDMIGYDMWYVVSIVLTLILFLIFIVITLAILMNFIVILINLFFPLTLIILMILTIILSILILSFNNHIDMYIRMVGQLYIMLLTKVIWKL